MRRSHRGLALGILTVVLVGAWLASGRTSPTQAVETDRIDVLLLTGKNNHDWEFTSREIERMLEATGRFDVTMTKDPATTLADPDAIADVDVFFIDYNGPRWGEAAERNFTASVRAGAGVVVHHAANNAFPGWTDYESMIGLAWREGTGHGRFHSFDVESVDLNHPITAGMPRLRAHPDELYHKMAVMKDARYRVLMSAYSSVESGGTGKAEPMVLVGELGKGRVFHSALGHVWRGVELTRASMRDPQLRCLIARGTEWAATGQCTLEPAAFDVIASPLPDERARDPWVFRCVLDGRPRSIVAALDRRMWLAYDAARGALMRAWAGNVDLVGSVYDSSHGPQPRSVGAPYAEGPDEGAVWRLFRTDGGKRTEVATSFRYVGYHIDGDRLVLQYRIGFEEGRIEVEESPEHLEGSRLERRFKIRGLPEGMELELLLGKMTVGTRLSLPAQAAAAAARVDLSEHSIRFRTQQGRAGARVQFAFALREGV